MNTRHRRDTTLLSIFLLVPVLILSSPLPAAVAAEAQITADPAVQSVPTQAPDQEAPRNNKITVSTTQGMYQGVTENGVSRFLGIPYALPPVGERRWQPPKPMRSHEGIVPATAVGAACLQTSKDRVSSEDCLRLNIWTPEVGSGSRPVMVWIHGGGFRGGSNDIRGEIFANPSDQTNPAVVVAMNYRLGPLGFFSHRAIKGKHANFGVLDMVAALQWVQENIARFGGNPDNVTIFGVSAGGMAVNVLMTSPLSKGLFHKAIAQSGYGTWPLARTRHAKGVEVYDLDGSVLPSAESLTAATLSNVTGTRRRARQSREELYALPGKAIVEGLDGFQLPYVDGQSIKAEPGIRFARNKQHKVSFITGGNSNEGSVMPGSGIDTERFAAGFGSDARSIRKLYERDFSRDDTQGWQRVFGDTRYLLAASVLGEYMATSAQDTWLYYIDFVPDSFKKQWRGTPHGADAWLMFNGDTSKDPAVVAFTRQLRSYWLNFAATGNPNAEGLPVWPAHGASGEWLLMAENSTARPAVIEKKLKLLKNRWQRRVSPAVR